MDDSTGLHKQNGNLLDDNDLMVTTNISWRYVFNGIALILRLHNYIISYITTDSMSGIEKEINQGYYTSSRSMCHSRWIDHDDYVLLDTGKCMIDTAPFDLSLKEVAGVTWKTIPRHLSVLNVRIQTLYLLIMDMSVFFYKVDHLFLSCQLHVHRGQYSKFYCYYHISGRTKKYKYIYLYIDMLVATCILFRLNVIILSRIAIHHSP